MASVLGVICEMETVTGPASLLMKRLNVIIYVEDLGESPTLSKHLFINAIFNE